MLRFAVLTVAAVLMAVGAAQALSAFDGSRHAPSSAEAAVVTDPSPPPAAAATPGEASIIKSHDGHYWAEADVDGHEIRFLVDTGATAVALTADDARRLGIEPSTLTYSYTVQTANGPARAAPVKLSSISIGGARVDGVDAFVIDKGLETSLLGMTYLGRLSKFEATQSALVLRS